jgi:hypothetical protein
MRPRVTWLRVIAGLAVLVVAGSAIAQSVRQGNWAPVLSVSWLLGVVAASWPHTGRGCWPGRRAGAGRGRQMSHLAG